jgi:Chromate transport protein ChrA
MPDKRDFKFYANLFLILLKISALTFGGGLVIITIIRKEFVEKRGWFTEEEMTDFIAIAQSAPGAIVINVSILMGYRLAGVLGTVVALTATVLPPLVIISVITVFYSMFIKNQVIRNMMRGMQAGIAAIITDAVMRMLKPYIKMTDKFRQISSVIIMLLSFAAIYFFKFNIIAVLGISAVTGIILFRGKKS